MNRINTKRERKKETWNSLRYMVRPHSPWSTINCLKSGCWLRSLYLSLFCGPVFNRTDFMRCTHPIIIVMCGVLLLCVRFEIKSRTIGRIILSTLANRSISNFLVNIHTTLYECDVKELGFLLEILNWNETCFQIDRKHILRKTQFPVRLSNSCLCLVWLKSGESSIDDKIGLNVGCVCVFTMHNVKPINCQLYRNEFQSSA